MNRKLALKRLTKSDLTVFRWHFENNNAGNQKSINLNRDVIEGALFPALAAEAAAHDGRFSVDLFIYGPQGAPELNLQRKIIKGGSYKNWRLNGEFIENPPGQPSRFNTLQEGDFALFEFTGASYPETVRLCLIDAAHSPALHAASAALLDGRRMIAITEADIDALLQRAGVDDMFPIRGSGFEAALEDAAQGGLEGIRRLGRRSATRAVSREELKKARDRADETGVLGEQFVHEFLGRLKSEGRIESFVWVSASSATAPYDFKQTVVGAEQLIDVKSTMGIFTNRVHVSAAELFEMRDSPCEYFLHRVYAIDGDRALLRISEPTREFATRVLRALENLPTGVTADSVSIALDTLRFGAEHSLRITKDEE